MSHSKTKKEAAMSHETKGTEVTPEKLIPMEDGDFGDF
jgi:hypothetical protein